MTKPSLLLSLCVLCACGGAPGPADSGSGNPGPDGGGNPGVDAGGRPGADGGGNPGEDGGGNPGADGGGNPGADGGANPGADGGGNPGGGDGDAGQDGGPVDDGGSAANYTLTVDLVGANSGESVTSSDGNIFCQPGQVQPMCSATYAAGTQVTLSASAGDFGYWFGDWNGGGCSGDGGCVITVQQAVAVTATFHAYLVYSYNDTLTGPTGLSTVNVQVWGGGGQGGYVGTYNSSLACYTGTGGGGGGAYNEGTPAVQPGQSYPITVGCGGCVYSTDNNLDNSGGSSDFAGMLEAGGGGGGGSNPPVGGTGGGCTGPQCAPGTAGSPGSPSACPGANGGAAGGPDGGAGGVFGVQGGNGGAPGGGGAGSEGIAGGQGGPGEVIVSW